MPIPGTPNVAARKLVHADVERPIVADAHVRNKEIFTPLEQEECPIPFGTEPFTVLLHKVDDLRLRETQRIEIGGQTVEDLAEGAVLDHLVDGDLLFLRRLTRDVETPVTEVTVEVSIESILGFGDGFGAVRRIEGNRFRTRDEFQTSADNFRHFRQESLDEILDPR